MTADEFERGYADRSGVTIEWLRAQGRIVKPCQCSAPNCQGWQSINAADAAILERDGML